LSDPLRRVAYPRRTHAQYRRDFFLCLRHKKVALAFPHFSSGSLSHHLHANRHSRASVASQLHYAFSRTIRADTCAKLPNYVILTSLTFLIEISSRDSLNDYQVRSITPIWKTPSIRCADAAVSISLIMRPAGFRSAAAKPPLLATFAMLAKSGGCATALLKIVAPSPRLDDANAVARPGGFTFPYARERIAPVFPPRARRATVRPLHGLARAGARAGRRSRGAR
jgi:hypothetical protein